MHTLVLHHLLVSDELDSSELKHGRDKPSLIITHSGLSMGSHTPATCEKERQFSLARVKRMNPKLYRNSLAGINTMTRCYKAFLSLGVFLSCL